MNAAWTKLGGATRRSRRAHRRSDRERRRRSPRSSTAARSPGTRRRTSSPPNRPNLASALTGSEVPGQDVPQAPPAAQASNDGGGDQWYSNLQRWWWLLAIIPDRAAGGCDRRRRDAEPATERRSGAAERVRRLRRPPTTTGTSTPVRSRYCLWPGPAYGPPASGRRRTCPVERVVDACGRHGQHDDDDDRDAETRLGPTDLPDELPRRPGLRSTTAPNRIDVDPSQTEPTAETARPGIDGAPELRSSRSPSTPLRRVPTGRDEEAEPASGPPSGRHAAIVLDEPAPAQTALRLALDDPYQAPEGYPDQGRHHHRSVLDAGQRELRPCARRDLVRQ